jgi:hypothetical protein
MWSVCRVKSFHLDGKYLADDEDVETEVRKWLRQQSETSVLMVSTKWNKCINFDGEFVEK